MKARQHRSVFRLVGLGCVSLLLTGCVSEFTSDNTTIYRVPQQRLREIDTISLEEQSRSEPVSVEQAAAELAERVVEKKPPAEFIELSLADVRAAALANNLDLRVALVDAAIAQETVSQEEAKFESVFFGSARRGRTEYPVLAEEDVRGRQSATLSYETGVRIPLRTGGTVNVSLPISKSASDDSSPTYKADLRFSISQPLLRAAGLRINTHSIRVAKLQSQVWDARTKLEAIRVLANADRAYWRLYAARRELEVRQQQYELALKQLQQAQKRVAAKDAPRVEITRAESGLAARLEAIIIAETMVRRRERDLKRVMNRHDLPIDSPTAIIPTTEPNPVGLDLDPHALGESAVKSRMEMLELELQLAIDASTIDFARNSTLPLSMLDYSYSVHGVGGNLDQDFDVLGGNDFADWSVQLGCEIPIGNRAAKANLHRAVLQRVQRLATRERRRLAIEQEVYDAVDQLEQNWQRILAARQEAILAGRTYQAEQRQFELARRTSTDVLWAAERLASAQSREIQALVDYQISRVDIAFATGTLLGHGRVRWEPIKAK